MASKGNRYILLDPFSSGGTFNFSIDLKSDLSMIKAHAACDWYNTRLMTMSPLHPCGKPCSTGTHNETVKNLALIAAIINGIMMKSRLRISIPWVGLQFFNRIEILSDLHRNNSNSQISQCDCYSRNRPGFSE